MSLSEREIQNQVNTVLLTTVQMWLRYSGYSELGSLKG